jgi:hypothetical protein
MGSNFSNKLPSWFLLKLDILWIPRKWEINLDGWIPIWHSLQIMTRNCEQNAIPNVSVLGISDPNPTENYHLVLVFDAVNYTILCNTTVIPLFWCVAASLYSSNTTDRSDIQC